MKLETKKLLLRYKIRPSKKLSQNFLVEKGIINKLIETADLSPNDIVLEPGPGLGALTLALADEVKLVIAVEKDPRMAKALTDRLSKNGINNVQVINRDILDFQFSISNFQLIFNGSINQFQNKKINYKITANLPYNIAAAVVMKFLRAENPPKTMAVLLQKEVAKRITAKPPKMNKLAVVSQLYSQVKIVKIISRNNFTPKPTVDSALVKISAIQKDLPQIDLQLFSRLVKAGFSNPRKQLLNNLRELNSRGLKKDKSCICIKKWLKAEQIEPSQRPQTLSVGQWIGLTKTFPAKLLPLF